MIDRYLGGGLLGGLGLTMLEPSWPTLAANQVQFIINATIGLGSFIISAFLSATVPATATFSVPGIGASVLPALVGMIVTTALVVFRGRS
jgi:hypothetical protein